MAAIMVSRPAGPCRIDGFLRRVDRSAVLAVSPRSAASISLVVRSLVLAHSGGWRRDRFLLRLLYIRLPHAGCADRILQRRYSFRSDRRALILRRRRSRS